MSRQYNEERTGRKAGKAGAGAKDAQAGFITFHPTEAEKKAVKALELEGVGLLEFLASLTERGLQTTLTRNRSDTALCLLIKERGLEFGKGTTLAFFHSNVDVLVAQAVYALTTKWPKWPETPVAYEQHEFDW